MNQQATTQETWTFDVDAIGDACRKDVIAGLRALADSIEAGHCDGRLFAADPTGMHSWRDPRHHVLVTFDIAAEPVRTVDTRQHKERIDTECDFAKEDVGARPTAASGSAVYSASASTTTNGSERSGARSMTPRSLPWRNSSGAASASAPTVTANASIDAAVLAKDKR